MLIFKKTLPRRSFLRGAGAAMALPFLDAMVPAFASSGRIAKPPLRLGYIYLPVGRMMENWTPKTVGANFELSPTLEPLAAFRDKLLVLSGLDIKAAHILPGQRGGGNHHRPCASFLTGVHPFVKPNLSVGISADQVVAKKVGHNTRLASMQLGLDRVERASGNEGDYGDFLLTTISWSGDTTPLPMQVNPRSVFERLFGDTDSMDPETTRRRIQQQSSVLDSVKNQSSQLMGAVDTNDRHRLEEYFNAVREIERGIQLQESELASGKKVAAQEDVKRPAGIPSNYMEHAKLMFDLILLAYQTNQTQVVSFMLGHEGSTRNYLELGAKDGHHSLTHHKGDLNAINLVKKIDLYQSELLAYFLGKMQSTVDGEGSLLDNSVIVAGSGLSDANIHLHTNVPVIVIGGGQGKIKGGQHIRYNSEPLSNLHLSIMDMFGVSPKEFLSSETSDGTGTLKGLT